MIEESQKKGRVQKLTCQKRGGFRKLCHFLIMASQESNKSFRVQKLTFVRGLTIGPFVFKNRFNSEFQSLGTLIAENHRLLSAHCTTTVTELAFEIRFVFLFTSKNSSTSSSNFEFLKTPYSRAQGGCACVLRRWFFFFREPFNNDVQMKANANPRSPLWDQRLCRRFMDKSPHAETLSDKHLRGSWSIAGILTVWINCKKKLLTSFF